MYSAAAVGAADAVRVLLRAGADASIASKEGCNTPLHAAALHSHTDVAVALMLGATGFDALWAARNRDGETAAEIAWELGIDLKAELEAARSVPAAAGAADDGDSRGRKRLRIETHA